MEGDKVLKSYAELLSDTVAEITPEDAFVGHVGGDDFVIITGYDDYTELAAELCRRFDDLAPSFYEPGDRERGWIEVENRQGEMERVGFVGVDIGIAHSDNGQFAHPGEAVTVATEMKHVAKTQGGNGSTYAADRRGVS